MIDDPLNRNKVKRGSELPWAKLNEEIVKDILDVVEQREKMKKELRTLSNSALARRYGVHVRTIDRITAGEGWIHV